MQKTFKWGIMGPGLIAHRFMESLNKLPDTELAACASLTPGRAEAFARKFGAPRWYDSYEALVQDSVVDAIYISTTNQKHMDNAILALNNGKPVLCEKPLAVNEKQVYKMIEAAKKNNVFLMEAMWTRFLPFMNKLESIIEQKVIGNIKVITGDFSYNMPGYSIDDISYRGFDPTCAGGGLIDVGIYVLSFACKILKKTPTSVSGLAAMTPLNVDAHSIAVFGFDEGVIVSAYSGIDAKSSWEATIYGSEGYIRVPNFFQADTIVIYKEGQKEQIIQIPFDTPGFQYEILETQRCISEGLTESTTMPLRESLEIIRSLDKLRMNWGLKYPCE
jgi:dihydrodiol dehydrogenase / D-xylose 1-dehydrogenase (NADP)